MPSSGALEAGRGATPPAGAVEAVGRAAPGKFNVVGREGDCTWFTTAGWAEAAGDVAAGVEAAGACAAGAGAAAEPPPADTLADVRDAP